MNIYKLPYIKTPKVKGIAKLADYLDDGRLGMDDSSKPAKSNPGKHGHGDLADHIAGMAADDAGKLPRPSKWHRSKEAAVACSTCRRSLQTVSIPP